ncbi:MAG: endoribonuclease MazF [Terriglobales bacterium]
MSYVPDAGDLVTLDFDPQSGHEQAGHRPAIVLTPKSYNQKSSLVIVAPITNSVKGYPLEVQLPAGLRTTGVVLTDQVKSVDWKARGMKYREKSPVSTLEKVREILRVLLLAR